MIVPSKGGRRCGSLPEPLRIGSRLIESITHKGGAGGTSRVYNRAVGQRGRRLGKGWADGTHRSPNRPGAYSPVPDSPSRPFLGTIRVCRKTCAESACHLEVQKDRSSSVICLYLHPITYSILEPYSHGATSSASKSTAKWMQAFS